MSEPKDGSLEWWQRELELIDKKESQDIAYLLSKAGFKKKHLGKLRLDDFIAAKLNEANCTELLKNVSLCGPLPWYPAKDPATWLATVPQFTSFANAMTYCTWQDVMFCEKVFLVKLGIPMETIQEIRDAVNRERYFQLKKDEPAVS